MAQSGGTYQQPPRHDAAPNRESVQTLRRWSDAITNYLERLRRDLNQEVPVYTLGTATYDPPNLVDGAGATTTVTVQGALLGDLAFASFSLDLQGITLTAYVSSANTVSVRFQNESGGALDLASGTLRAWVLYPPQHAV